MNKLISVIYIAGSSTLVEMPLVFFVLNKKTDDWMLPLGIKIVGISNSSHPGYELSYFYCGWAIVDAGVLIAGTFKCSYQISL